MSRRPNVIRPVKLTLHLPEDIYVKVATHLYSPSAQRIPDGAWQRFFIARINEFFAKEPS